jgi:hypothetical protein
MLKLTVANYATWKTKIEMLLIQQGLRPIVSQRHLRPTVTTSHSTGSASSRCTRRSAAGPINNDEEVRKWDEEAEQATATIFLYLDERAECNVNDIRDTVELRGKLQNIYERKGFSARFHLWQKLFTLPLTDYREHEGNEIYLYLDTY